MPSRFAPQIWFQNGLGGVAAADSEKCPLPWPCQFRTVLACSKEDEEEEEEEGGEGEEEEEEEEEGGGQEPPYN